MHVTSLLDTSTKASEIPAFVLAIALGIAGQVKLAGFGLVKVRARMG